MKLYGMLDSPYVRRVAISLDLMGIAFTHHPLSVFSTFEAFAAINPVVKAPSLVLDDGTVLMDSSLILEYARSQQADAQPLQGSSVALVGLALAACEKAVQIVYERNLRPDEKQHQPWLDRVTRQLLAACSALEAGVGALPDSEVPDQAAITTTVAWSFIQLMLPEVVKADDFAQWRAQAQKREGMAVFGRYPMVP